MMRFLLILLFILLAKVDYSLSTCPKPCVCIRRRAYCDQTQIKAMPPNLPRYLTYINMAKNYLRRLNWRRLRRLSNLKHIVADSNKIFTLDNRIFKACPNLTSLSIADNRLGKIMDNDTFSGLGRLRALNMADNRLTDLKAVLWDLENLLYFSAAGNRLTSLSSEEFAGNPNLKVINLEENLISFIAPDAFLSLKDLRRLNLRKNLLNSLVNLNFAPSVSLKVLDLSFSSIQQLNISTDSEAPFLNVRLNDNNLTSLTILSRNSSKLLNINRNRLLKISKELLQIELESLYAKKNRISEIQPESFDAARNLRLLDLSDNQISALRTGTFQYLKNLQILDLSSNPISSLQSIGLLPNLRILHMNSIQNISQINEFILDLNASKLLILSLSNSSTLAEILLKNISVLSKWTNIQEMNLSYNGLRNLPAQLLDILPNLGLIDITHNNWYCDVNIWPLVQWLKIEKIKFLLPNSLSCSSPKNLMRTNLFKLEYSKLSTNLNHASNSSSLINVDDNL